MKKAISITIGAIAGTTTLIAGGVFLPSLYLNSSPSTVKVNSDNVFVSNSAKGSVTVKEAIMGTKKVNSGNYVLYFGSEGIDSNFKFLYNVTDDALEQTKEEQMLHRNQKLSGDYWNVVNYVSNNIKAKEELVRPEFIAYVNLLGEGARTSCQRIADEATSCLRDVLDARETYSKLSDPKRDEIRDKYNFVKEIMISDSDRGLQQFLGTSVSQFFQNLKENFNRFTNTNLADPKATVYEAVTWTVLPTSIPLKTNPFDTYQSWDKKTKYYDNSAYTQDFRDLWNFIQNYTLFNNRKPKDINTNNGFVLGYKNGVLTDFYDDSFTSSTTEGDGNTENTDTPTRSIKTSKPTEVAPEPSSQNSFYEWIKKQYSAEKNSQ